MFIKYLYLCNQLCRLLVYRHHSVRQSVQMPCKHNSSLTDDLVIKLYTIVVYDLKMCKIEDISRSNYFKGDNFKNIISKYFKGDNFINIISKYFKGDNYKYNFKIFQGR